MVKNTSPILSALKVAAMNERAAVEFALVLIPLLLIIGGIIDGGWLFADKIALNQSVREGARIVVVQPVGAPTPTVTLVRNAAADTFIGDPSAIVVTTTGSCADPGIGNNITVKATYLAKPPMGIVNALIPGNVLGPTTLTSQATFKCEW